MRRTLELFSFLCQVCLLLLDLFKGAVLQNLWGINARDHGLDLLIVPHLVHRLDGNVWVPLLLKGLDLCNGELAGAVQLW
jgi:hypothetical protein